jgi:hypothetical protein
MYCAAAESSTQPLHAYPSGKFPLQRNINQGDDPLIASGGAEIWCIRARVLWASAVRALCTSGGAVRRCTQSLPSSSGWRMQCLIGLICTIVLCALSASKQCAPSQMPPAPPSPPSPPGSPASPATPAPATPPVGPYHGILVDPSERCLNGQSYFVIWLTCATLVLMCNSFPPDLTLLGATTVLLLLGIISEAQARIRLNPPTDPSSHGSLIRLDPSPCTSLTLRIPHLADPSPCGSLPHGPSFHSYLLRSLFWCACDGGMP